MQVIIFDKTADSDLTGVGVITPTQKALVNGLDLTEYAAEILPSGTAFEIVDDSILPWDQPREAWEWE